MAFIIDGTTGIATVDGSVSAPSQRGQDTNSGISYASDTIKFSTNGVERLAISNSGLSGDGSGLTGISAGITMVDTWVVTTAFNSTNADITANWSRQQTPATHFGGFGSAMTESSGIFTFPSNGHYYVESFISGYCNGSFRNYIGNEQKISTNSGSSYSTAIKGYTSGSGDSAHFSISIADVFDITSYSTTRWKLLFEAQGLCNIFGTTTGNTGRTGVVFIRLGDT